MSKTKKIAKKPGVSPKRGRKKATMYHAAAFNALSVILDVDSEDSGVVLQDELRLAEDALRVDGVLVKKNPGVEIKRVWGKFMRDHNLIEYKSPVSPALTLHVFNKVVHGYAGIYASQKKVKLTNMTITIVCARKPVRLFNTLKEDFYYEILRGDAGIYYIILKGVPVEKTLAVQIVVCSELPDSEILLKALKPDIDEDTARKVTKVINADVGNKLGLWTEVMFAENFNLLLKESQNMTKTEKIDQALKEYGFWDRAVEKGIQEGVLRTAKAMKDEGYDVETIRRITGLPADTVSRL